MNKRLIALFLCLVMMLSVFLAGCAEDSEESAKSELEEAKVANNMTLTMWIVSESPVSDEIRTDVTNAINALTRTKYKTQLEIHYLSEEEYFSKLTAAMEAYAENKKQQNANKPVQTGTETSGEGEGTTVEEIVTDEHGMYRDNYPVVLENQVDIIYIGDLHSSTEVDSDEKPKLLMSGQQMYNKLREGDWLASLDDAIKGDAKKIKEFVSPTLLSAVQEKGATYAIPNNNVIGEYTYMCLNKELMDKYSLQGHLTRGSIKSFANEYVYQFIDQISRYESADLLPIDATYEECLAQLAYYWNVDPETYEISNNEFSIFGTPLFDTQLSRGQNIAGVQSLFENEEFTEHYIELNEYRLEDMYRFVKNPDGTYSEDTSETITFFRNEENKDKEYAAYGIKFEKGTLEALNAAGNYVDPETGVEYYAIPVAYPTATAEDIYGNMFAVAKTTLSVERSMQVITYLNTNSEIRNLLQYGIQGQHYTVEKNVVSRIADKAGNYYEMDVYATGNTFLAHLESGMNAAIWENGKKQNRDSLVEPLLGFDLAEYALSNTQFGIPTEVAATKTYKTTFRSELSKEAFANDEVLSAWLKACDEQGKGVYIFRSRQETTNKEYEEILYFYNNTGSYRFSVETLEESKEGGGFYRNNTYIYTKDSKLPVNYGYTLTMVYDICPIRYVKTVGEEGEAKVEVPISIVNRTLNNKGEEDENSRTECTYVETFNYKTTTYDFDLYETDSYSLNIYGDLYIGDFYDNNIIYEELKKQLIEVTPEKKEDRKKENLGLYWKDTTSSEEKDYHSFLFYRANIEYTTLVDVIPSLAANKLTLIVNYDEQEHSGEIQNPTDYNPNSPGVRPGKRYTLYYVTLEIAKGVDVSLSYNLSETTTTELEMKLLVNEYAADTTKTSDLVEVGSEESLIDFDVCGLLNTEVVKLMTNLNDLVISKLNECDTMEMLKRRVNYFSILLNTEKQVAITDFPLSGEDEYDEVIDALLRDENSIVYRGNFMNLFYQLTHITNYGTMVDVQENGLGDMAIGHGVEVDREEYRPVAYSPYGIYYLWMEAYQYLPANMQTGN